MLRLRDLGNTVLVVEHDEETMKSSDHVIDIGWGAGEQGGEIVAEGSWEKVSSNIKSVTGQYLSGNKSYLILRFVETERMKILSLEVQKKII